MFIGHYAAAFIGATLQRGATRTALAKPVLSKSAPSSLAPSKPVLALWQAFLAVQFIDIIWAVLIALRIEKVSITPGFTATNALDLYFIPYSHSLLFCAVWAVIGGVGFKVLTRASDWRGAVIFGVLVFSHWLGDFISHVPDLPLWPGSDVYGLGLWNMRDLNISLEIAGVMVCALIYGARTGVSRRRLFGLIVVMTALQIHVVFGPVPTSVTALAVSALLGFAGLCVAAAFVERGSRTPA